MSGTADASEPELVSEIKEEEMVVRSLSVTWTSLGSWLNAEHQRCH